MIVLEKQSDWLNLLSFLFNLLEKSFFYFILFEDRIFFYFLQRFK